MRRNKNQILPILVLVLLFVGVVYAILQTNLQINGTTKIANNLWDVHFANVVVNSNSVPIGTGDSAATIDSNNTLKVDFSVTLSLPGDFYEFTVDVVNGGTIDAMIGTLTKSLKVNNVEIEVPDYLNYIVTYDDDTEVVEKQLLAKNSSKKIKVRVEFKSDIDEEDLPEATTLSMTVELTYVQADNSAIYDNTLYNVFKLEEKSGSGLVEKYTNNHNDSFTKPATYDIYHWSSGLEELHIPYDSNAFFTVDGASSSSSSEVVLPPLYERIENKWNVLFAGYCWQMYRTTDTGGVKLLYNGEPNQGKCMNTAEGQQIGTSKYNANYNSDIYVGYMYNPDTAWFYKNGAVDDESLFGKTITYSEGIYTLGNTSSFYNINFDYYPYTCNNMTGSCSTVRYYVSYGDNNVYVELSGGKTLNQAVDDMHLIDDKNKVNSTMKTFLENWYRDHMTAFTSQLEDTIFCCDRSPKIGSHYCLGSSYRDGSLTSNVNLSCTNQNDQFSVSNDKAPLEYPVGLVTAQELKIFNPNLVNTGSAYWTASPSGTAVGVAVNRYVGANGSVLFAEVNEEHGVRPVVSLKPGTTIVSGDGSKDNPYVVG